MKRKKPLTGSQQLAVSIAEQHGSINYYRGGFWAKPNDELKGILVKEDFRYPLVSVGVGTVEALIKRGLMYMSDYARSGWGKLYPVEAKLFKKDMDELQEVKASALKTKIKLGLDFATIWKTGESYGFNFDKKEIGYSVSEHGVTRTVVDVV